MMLQQQGVPGLMGNSGDAAAAAEAREPGGGGGSTEVGAGFNEEEKGRSDESERSSGGNRWPRQETIALLKIRSDMDVAFRDSSLKGPLWDEVSRKLAELGYHRSAKKCKEKFENVYKYHKRTKDGRTTKPDGKAYRFFEQLEALDNTHPQFSVSSSPIKSQLPIASNTLTSAMLGSTTINVSSTTPMVSQFTVSSTPSPISTVYPNNVTPIMHHPTNHPSQPTQPNSTTNATVSSQGISGLPSYNVNLSASLLSNSTSSSSTSSDQEPERYRKRKRKCKDFFGKLMTEVIKKQDALQKKFLDTLEERERDRMIREEAWRAQETAKMNREHDLLAQERSMAAAKDAAIIAFLQKISDQQNLQIPIAPTQLHQIQVQVQENRMAQVQAPPPVVQQHRPPPAPVQAPTPAPVQAPPVPSTAPPIEAPAVKSMDIVPTNNGTDNFMSPSPSRWPKAEVQALIKLRTTLDNKYNESGPKGPLWEEISGMMRKLGYNRNAKRCKEKWENINKYYKKVKESSKKRPEDAKTCPYFHQLEALYKEKNKTEGNSFNPGFNNKPENPTTVPIMVQPEQQWPLTQPHHQQQQQDTTMAENEIEKMGQNDEDDYEDDDEDDEDDGAGYEIVTNKQPSSVATAE